MEHLPIDDVLDEVVAQFDDPGVVVVTAPPGAGKTTRVALALVDRPWRQGRIVLLEPRRVAARAAANRMAQQLGQKVGQTIGLTTRDERKVGPQTVVEVVTEGVVVRRLLRHGDLPGTSAVLFDEFHERSLDADLGLALVLELREVLRPDLRVGILSATMDAEGVAAFVGGRAVASHGRAHPVQVEHVAGPVLHGRRPREIGGHVAMAVRDALLAHDGDVLVFLPGVGEIRATREALGGVDADVLELHGGLPGREQDRALQPGDRRRVVLSTDLAESSVTVPGVRVVVDAGLAREPRLDARIGMTRLVTVPASRAAADQRAGRAGRVAPGHAVRLWSTSSHASREAWPRPELHQAELAGFRLAVAQWGAHPAELRLLDEVPVPALEDADATLRSLGALDLDGRITEHGRRLADLPLHPRLAHLLVRAAEVGQGELGAVVAALLSERDVLGRDHARPDADLLTRVRLVRGGAGSGSRVRRGALETVRREVRRLERLAGDLPRGGEQLEVDDDAAVAVLLASTWPERIGRRRPGRRGVFQLAAGRGAVVHEGDPLADAGWIVAADVDAGAVDARVHRAVALDAELFDGPLASLVRNEDRVRFDDRAGDVEAVRVRAVGDLVLASSPLPSRDVDLRPALMEAVRARGVGVLTWSSSATALRARMDFLHRTVGDPWPDVSDAGLVASLDSWLLGAVPPRARRLGDLRNVSTVEALRNLVPPTGHRDLGVLAPTHLDVPSGSRVRLDYTPEGPVLAVKVQEVFGWEASPTVAGGRVPVVIHLLSPAGRPLQVTADLAGFWDGAWSQVRAEMRGRYPKHAWPEDPREVPAHRGTKRRPRRG